MKLLVDTNGLRKKANEGDLVEDFDFGIQSGFLKPAFLNAIDWTNSEDMEHLKYQLKLELSASTNIRPLQRLFQQTPLMPDPYFHFAGWHNVLGNLSSRFSTEPAKGNQLLPAIYLETLLMGEMQLQVQRDDNLIEFVLKPGDAVYFSVHQDICSNVRIKRESPTAVSMSAIYYVVDERFKELPSDFERGNE